MSNLRRLVRCLTAIGLVCGLMAFSLPLTAQAGDELFPVVTHNPKTDDEEVYIWSTVKEDAYKLCAITDDDLLNFASAPAGSTIQFPADGNRGTVSLTYKGKGEFTGKFETITFTFKREDAAGVALNDWNAWALAEARVKALRAMGRPAELAVAEAVLKVLAPIHSQLALDVERELVSKIVAKVAENKDTGNQELWAYVPDSKASYKLITLAKDDLMTFASARVGVTIKFPAQDNRGTITLTYKGKGLYTGTYLGATFSFTRSDMADILLGDPGMLSLAKARVPALLALGRTDEWNVAKAVLDVLQP